MAERSSKTSKKLKGISIRLLIVLAIFCAILLAFFLITDEIVLEKETGLDDYVFSFLKTYTMPEVTNKMIFLTFFGSHKFLFPAYTILALYFLFFKKNTLRSFNVAAIGLSSVALLFLIKDIFKRHRPPHPLLANVSGFSFPSGHSFSAFTFCGLLIYILWETQLHMLWKWIGTVLLFFFAASIAISRVYLHVHYASDVLAGFCLSILWLTICFIVLNRFETREERRILER